MSHIFSREWFEMRDLRRRRFENAGWIPLRAGETINPIGQYGRPGSSEELFCAGCIAVPKAKQTEAERLGWMDIGLSNLGGPHAFSDGSYKACEIYQYRDGEDLGISLVFEQHVVGDHPKIWHINQDLILALRLVQEGDSWVRPEENFVEVIRQRRDSSNQVTAIEIRTEFLRDYLAARGMALRLSYYRQRMAVLNEMPQFGWPKDGLIEERPHDRFNARLFEIDETGGPYGASVGIFHAWRTDIDPEEDVPIFGREDNTNTQGRSVTYNRGGTKYFRAEGELWREEWIEPGQRSERVRRDEPLEAAYFTIDASGNRASSKDLNNEDIGRYLWFDPKLIVNLLGRRGSGIKWHTRYTGSIWCSPDSPIHFGVNRLGMINVYAYDVARQDPWQQKIWAGFNITPDGAVSAELLESQMRAQPAGTAAPEKELPHLMDELDTQFEERYGNALFKSHQATPEILRNIHRFRAVENHGLLALSKDIARLIADRIDIAALHKIAAPPKGEKWGSLKSLEKVLATRHPAEQARSILTPLVGVYELRLGDAHLPSSTITEAMAMVGVRADASPVAQGLQLIDAVVGALTRVKETA